MPIFFKPTKSVVIILDFAYRYVRPEGVGDWARRLLIRCYHSFSLRRCVAAVAISEATRQDAIRFHHLSKDKVRVVHLGYRHICALPETPLRVPEKFLLFVGVLKARKNLHTLIKAFAKFWLAHPEYHLLLCGKAHGPYVHTLHTLVEKFTLQERVRFLGYRSDGELSYLYRRAAALVYPSIVEGFGFPILEAMDCGTPVITSTISSLPEIAGDAAILVDPQKPEEMADAMERIADDNNIRKVLVERGRRQAVKFSWERSAQEFRKLIGGI